MMADWDHCTDQAALRAALRQGAQPKYLLFWGHRPRQAGVIDKACLSQWWPVTFTVAGVAYASAEHFMMAEKARLFGDEAVRQQILQAASPAAAKQYGRTVRGFDEAVWVLARSAIVVRGNQAKFAQHPALKQFLLNTRGRVLVEASPVDRVWGIGLAADDPAATQPERWQGLNLLGFALMQVRRCLDAAEPVSGTF